MPDIKVPEVPAHEVAKPKDETPDDVVIDNPRAKLENAVFEKNAEVPEIEKEVIPEVPAEKPEKTDDEPDDEADPVERIKKITQKRIDKITAKAKTAEEKLAEAQAEIERLKTNPKEVKPEAKDTKPPTQAEVKAYIVKMQTEGNFQEATEATDYLLEMKKNEAIKNLTETRTAEEKRTADAVAKTNRDLQDLANDYVVYNDKGEPDAKADLTLANKQGILFKLASDYYNDKTRHAERYDNPNVVEGFRRAVGDAFRDITEYQRTNKTPKGEAEPKRNFKAVLAEPDAADFSEETPAQVRDSNSLSDAEKVREEIKLRNKNRYSRKVPVH